MRGKGSKAGAPADISLAGGLKGTRGRETRIAREDRASDEPPVGSHTPPRFFVEPSMVLGAQIVLSGETFHHAKAQRLSPGETFTAVLGDTVYSAKVDEILQDRLTASIVDRRRAVQPKEKVHLYAALLKGQNFDLVVEKATELGAYSITPVVTRRTIPRIEPAKAAERKERWVKVARSASEQSGRVSVPEIRDIIRFGDLIAMAKRDVMPGGVAGSSGLTGSGVAGVRLFGHEHEGLTVDLGQAVRGFDEASILIGPEGGLDADEVRDAMDAGFVPVSLGPYILKAETAAIAAVSLLMYHLRLGL